LRSTGQDLPFIIISGTIGEETAVSALKSGAHDFLIKGRLARLVPALEARAQGCPKRGAPAASREQLRQSQKMEAIGQLAGGIAHIQQSAHGDSGYSELLRDRSNTLTDSAPISTRSRRAGERAASLTDNCGISRKQRLELQVLEPAAGHRRREKMLRRIIGEISASRSARATQELESRLTEARWNRS